MKRLLIVAATAVVALATLGVGPASAREAGDVFRIRALLSPPVGPAVCPGAVLPPAFPPTANLMSGSLVGCWYTDTGTLDAFHDNGNGTYTITESGTEHYVGCIKHDRDGACTHEDPSGTWRTTYVFIGTFDSSTNVELSGGCTHPIIPGSGTGNFTGVRGTIFMTDNVNNGTSNVTGRVVLADETD